MRSFTVIAALILLCSNLSASPGEDAVSLSVAIKRALVNNQGLKAKKELVRESAEYIKEVESEKYPRFDFHAIYSRYDSDFNFLSPPGWWQSIFPAGEREFFSARLSFFKDIYAGGRVRRRLDLARSNKLESEAEYDAHKNTLVYDVTKTFYRLLYLKEKANSLNRRAAILERRISSSRKGSPGHRKLVLQLSGLEMEQEDIDLEYRNGLLRFNQLLGIDISTELQITGDFDYKDLNVDLPKALIWASQYRAELKKHDETIKGLGMKKSIIRAERLPVLSAGAAYEYRGEKFPLREENWWGIIDLNFPVFDGWRSWTREKKIKIRIEKEKIARAEIEDAIRKDVIEAYNRLVSVQKNLKRITEKIKNIETFLASDNDEGMEDMLWEAGNSYLDCIYEFLLARAGLELAVGAPIPEK